MKISSILRYLVTRRAGNVEVRAAWADDPYAHPDISAMTERERADLPPTHMPTPRRVLHGETPSGVLRIGLVTCT